ncbi:hypothetical protein QTP86_030520 [Hemibagrus guttatus]|nr:hypothetical protein QTP86_030520 [Hemibagrus guttatus]
MTATQNTWHRTLMLLPKQGGGPMGSGYLFRIDYKLALLTYKALNGLAPTLCECNLTEESCRVLSSVLSSNSSSLREMNLSNNKLQDSGMKLLGMWFSFCCSITDEGCTALASALRSNFSSHQRELDLYGNNPGESGVKLLSDLLKDPHSKLDTLQRKEDKETWWWNEEVQDSIQRKRLAKKKWDMDKTEENRQECKELQRRVKREVSKAKQKAYDEMYTRLHTREGEKDLYSCPHYPLQGLAIQDGAIPKPGSDAAAQDTLDGPSVEHGQDGGR